MSHSCQIPQSNCPKPCPPKPCIPKPICPPTCNDRRQNKRLRRVLRFLLQNTRPTLTFEIIWLADGSVQLSNVIGLPARLRLFVESLGTGLANVTIMPARQIDPALGTADVSVSATPEKPAVGALDQALAAPEVRLTPAPSPVSSSSNGVIAPQTRGVVATFESRTTDGALINRNMFVQMILNNLSSIIQSDIMDTLLGDEEDDE